MGEYADLPELRMFYEVEGDGEPLVLLHGGFGGAYMFSQQIPMFSEHFRVFVPEQRGRGRTPDVPGPFTYQLLTDDIIAFLEKIVNHPAHIVGVSDGGIVGLYLAMKRPDILRKAVFIGANFHWNGIVPGSGWTELAAEDEAWDMPRQRYAALSPDGPEHWPVIFSKVQKMASKEPTFKVSDLGTVSIPVLIMSGDDDAISLEHTIAMYQALPEAQLAIIPGTSHAEFVEKPALVNQLILDFLTEEEPPSTLLPIRRRKPIG
jgi:pimeloyl-ACP methyl ester carboxylesterase